MKLYFPIPEVALGSSNSSVDLLSVVEGNASLKSRQNMRASYLSGQNIYGDAILANVGYTRRSSDLFFEDTSLCSYYRSVVASLCLVLTSVFCIGIFFQKASSIYFSF